jgi:hypothetical protein
MALVGNLVFYLRAKLETKSVTPDTAFRFNSKVFLVEQATMLAWRFQISLLSIFSNLIFFFVGFSNLLCMSKYV